MLEDIREMKRQAEAQIESRGQREIEVKLGRGGIRDIEFTVQMLQMLYGGRMTSLQTANTLLAIQALEVNEILRHFEAGTLVSNYIFLRTVEHRLQIEASAQVHALPADPPALEEFAQRLGYADADTFMSEYRFRAEATREILERFLHLKGDGMLWISDLLNPLSDGASSLPKLSEVGFKEARRAREEILLLSTGSSARPHTSHVRQQFNRIAPALIKALSGASDPDVTLSRLSRIIGNLRAPSAIYDILRWNPVLCEYLVQVVSNSRMLAEYLTRDPGLFETFGASGSLDDPTTEARLTEQLSELLRAHDPRAAIYRLKDGETLRIGLRELFVSGDIFDICGELTLLAEACVRHVCTEALALTQARFGPAEGGFCVLGLGKLGGRELGYGSDLDLVFVYESTATTDKNTNATEYFSSLASNVFKLLKEPTRYGILYDIDARLRPDGRKGMLAVSDARLESYYRDDAEAWERLALVKARYVAGDPRLGQRIEERIRAIVFGEALTVDALNRIEEIRLRIVRNTTRRDLKKDEGGIAEIEFAIRLLQLRHVNQSADLMRGDVRGALEILVRNQWLNEVDAGVLGNAYTLFRRIENRIRMMDGTPGSALPEDVQQCQDLAARLGIHDELQELVARTKADVHRVYESVVASIREGLH